MKPKLNSQRLLNVTRSKAKMFEYNIPTEHHIKITESPDKLFALSIGLLGDLAANINRYGLDFESIAEQKKNLLFSARFFDSYFQSKLNNTLDPYFTMLGSASYYLCDLPGSSHVLAKNIEGDCPSMEGYGLEDLLLWLLQGNFETYFAGNEGLYYGKFIDNISQSYIHFYKTGTGEENLSTLLRELRDFVYEFGTSRQLLLGDVISAIIRKKIKNSVWKALPIYSDLPVDVWNNTIQKEGFIKELWPAQHLLGEKEVLKGKSAVIQMPTSAGKTKSIELILRSAFLAKRASLAIIIAPFRALCHEIKNTLFDAFNGESVNIDDFSDVFQVDFELSDAQTNQIFVVTPEKLLYILRQSPEIASQIDLLIFDEGHQFDNDSRGITYELLITSLLSLIPYGIQKILISAVISNAEQIGNWLIGEPYVVSGKDLTPTPKSIGFTSWKSQLGRIEYVNYDNIEENDFFVPRVVNEINLGKEGRETKDRIFPEKNEPSSIALYLGLKLVSQGSIAIFCGKKDTATTICKKAVDIIQRQVPMPLPLSFSDEKEIEQLHLLYTKNLGEKSTATLSAQCGIYSHHGSTPHGIRLALEYAMRENLVKFVVCTSTLAQGVNLPIRYLIVTNTKQGADDISVRDFHNLIGRAGRAGMHTEGSILFADAHIYDNKKISYKNKRWNKAKKLLDSSQSESCASSILELIPLKIKNDKYKIPKIGEQSLTWDILIFANYHISNGQGLDTLITKTVDKHARKGFTVETIDKQFKYFSLVLSSIESFILANFEFLENELEITKLAEQTLAYSLADEEQRIVIKKLFQLLFENISKNEIDTNRKKAFSKTLYGINDSIIIEQWVHSNIDVLLSISTCDKLIESVWELLIIYSTNKDLNNFTQKNVLKEMTKSWILGKQFYELLEIAEKRKCKIGVGKKPRNIKIENIVSIFEGGIAYDGSLLIGAIREFITLIDSEEKNNFFILLNLFQKQFKYGLPTEQTIALYELGFADRVIAQDLVTTLGIESIKREDIINEINQNKDVAISLMEKYPTYFQKLLYSML